eukprot:c5392_g1_i3.p1 GENE.c5392_g1_i3~~c5392_g1_i3.p1  ORF type:complete len:637 (+),score=146.58 c5392_g1_i3:33-1913(+)
MGKAKKQRAIERRNKRFDPAGQVELPKEGQIDMSSVPILQKLESVSAEEREAACSSVSQLCMDDQASLEALISARCIPLLVQRLFDADRPVRIAAFGALRNLSLVGGPEACDQIVRSDVMNSVVLLFQKMREEEQNQSAQSTEQSTILQKERVGILTQVFALLWNLCESNEEATEKFSRQSDIHGLTIEILSKTSYPVSLRSTVGQFLVVVTDKNQHEGLRKGILVQPSTSELLKSMLVPSEANPPIISTLSACILFNLWFDVDPEATVAAVIPTISHILRLSPMTELPAVIEALKTEQSKIVEMGEHPVFANFEEPELVSQWKLLASSQQLALETLTNALVTNDDASEDGDEDDIEMDPTEPETADVSPATAVKPFQVSAITACLPIALNLTAYPSDPVIASVAALQPSLLSHLTLVETVQLRAIAAVTNAITLIGAAGLAQQTGVTVQQIWTGFWGLSLRARALQHLKVLEATLSLLWTLLRSIGQGAALEIDEASFQMLCELAVSSQEDIRSTCAGLFGVLAARPYNPPFHHKVGEALIWIIANDSSLGVVCEALNSIFDVFAEPEYNTPYTQLAMGEKLRLLAQALPQRIKSGKMSREDRDHAKDALNNLKRFITYKKQQGV